MNYFLSFTLLVFLFPVSLTEVCEQVLIPSGQIKDSARQTEKTKCWTIEAPEDSYVELEIDELNFKNFPCSETYLKIDNSGEILTYCSENDIFRPITRILSSADIIYHHTPVGNYNGYYSIPTYYPSSFRISFSTVSLICARSDHFRCSPSKCILQHQVCNGVKDCENGADEVECKMGIAGIKEIKSSQESAISWLQKQGSASFGWGKNTHRAITALYLAEAANFTGDNLEEELMVKQLELQTAVALLRNSTDPISVSELSMFVNALKVTCHNPRNFFGHDFLKILGEQVTVADLPSPNAYLTLCNSNWTFTQSDINGVFKFLQTTSKYPFTNDVQAVAIMAISCMKKEEHILMNSDRKSLYEGTIKKFVAAQLSDGSFGNVYTTALVTQALISSGQEENEEWNVRATAHYLMKQLNSSSIDFLSTYLTLPIFSGRSLADVSNIYCSKLIRKQRGDDEISDVTNKLGGKMQVKYSLFVGDQKDVIHTIILRMPENSTAYDVMKVAQLADPKYKFHHRDVSGQMYVYDIAGITNDPEAGKFWLLYLEDLHEQEAFKHYIESPDDLVLGDAEHLIMWYKTATI